MKISFKNIPFQGYNCDVISEKGPYCGTNIIGPDQMPRMMRGVWSGPTIFVANEHHKDTFSCFLRSFDKKYYRKSVETADLGRHCFFRHKVPFRWWRHNVLWCTHSNHLNQALESENLYYIYNVRHQTKYNHAHVGLHVHDLLRILRHVNSISVHWRLACKHSCSSSLIYSASKTRCKLFDT